MWLSDMLKEHQPETEATVTCEYPGSVQGKSLLAISKSDFHCRKFSLWDTYAPA